MTDEMDRTDPHPLTGADRRDSVPEAVTTVRGGTKGRDMDAARHPSKFDEQRPIAWAGWLLALVAGAAIWLLLFRWWLG